MKRNGNICTESASKETTICGLTNNSMYEFLVERASSWLHETAIVYEGNYMIRSPKVGISRLLAT